MRRPTGVVGLPGRLDCPQLGICIACFDTRFELLASADDKGRELQGLAPSDPRIQVVGVEGRIIYRRTHVEQGATF